MRVMLSLCVLFVALMVSFSPAKAADQAVPRLAAVTVNGVTINVPAEGFTPATNYLSIDGYVRWQIAKHSGVWLTSSEVSVVTSGGQLDREAFPKERRYMSKDGHKRWLAHQETGAWPEANPQ
jgi:hypothetical protein